MERESYLLFQENLTVKRKDLLNHMNKNNIWFFSERLSAFFK